MNPVIRLATMVTAAFLAAATAGCSNEAAPVENAVPNGANSGIVAGTLEVTAARPTLTLRNTTEQVVGYMVVEKNQMVVAMYPPCANNCQALVQGATITIPYTSISGYSNSATEAMVMWWTYTRAADGTLQATGAVQTKNVKL